MKKKRLLYLAIIAAVGFSVMIWIVNMLQTTLTIKNQIENSAVKLEIAENRIVDNKIESEKDWDSYDSFMIAKADAIAFVIDTKKEAARNKEFLDSLLNTWGLRGLYVLSDNVISSGNIELTEHTIDEQ